MNLLSFWLFFSFWLFIIPMFNHGDNFTGSNQKFKLALNTLTVLYLILALVFIIYIGVIGIWWHSIVVLGISAIFGGIFNGGIRILIPDAIMALIGIIAAPVLLVLSFIFLN